MGSDNSDDPYGVGLASWLYWPVWFRRSGMKAWLSFLDKFAQPTVVGTYPPGTSEQDRDAILKAALAVSSSSAIRLPENHTLSFLEANRGGTADYKALDEIMCDTITQVILSQTMTTHSGASLAQARVHERVKLEIVKADGDLIADSFCAGPARWLTEWNYPDAAIPIVRRVIDDVPDRKALADTDVALAAIGWRRTPESHPEAFGDGYVWVGPQAKSGHTGVPESGATTALIGDLGFHNLNPNQPRDAHGRWVDQSGTKDADNPGTILASVGSTLINDDKRIQVADASGAIPQSALKAVNSADYHIIETAMPSLPAQRQKFLDILYNRAIVMAQRLGIKPESILELAAHESHLLGNHNWELRDPFGVTNAGGHNLAYVIVR